MKLWRKLAQKDEQGRRNGRQIAYMLRMQEMNGKTAAKSYPLLNALLNKAGIKFEEKVATV